MIKQGKRCSLKSKRQRPGTGGLLGKNKVGYNQKSNENYSLMKNVLAKYNVHINEKPPVGYYISRISDACRKNTDTGPVLEIGYMLEPLRQCYNRVNELIATEVENDIYYIKQTHSVGSNNYKNFVCAMENAFGVVAGTKILITDIVGVGEFVKIEYLDDSSICNISVRYPAFYKDINNATLQIQEENIFVKVMQDDEEGSSSKDVSSDNVQSKEIEEIQDRCTNREKLLRDDDDDDLEFDDYDDEFDDFMDDLE